MGSEETRTGEGQQGSGKTSNVVRIPRDWFGPKDDLVPFGPRAEEDWDSAGATSSNGSATSFDANVFWGEEADSVQDVVDEPSDAPAARRPLRGRALIAAGLIALMAGTGVAASLLTESGKQTVHPNVAAIKTPRQPALRHRLSARFDLRSVRRPTRLHERIKSAHHAAHPRTPTQVTHHADQSRSAPSAVYTQSTGASTPAVSSSTAAAPDHATASTASTASRAQSSQPAFGSDGALGPMSSPDG